MRQSTLSRDQALALLKTHNQERFHIEHALTVEAIMAYLADKLGYGEEMDYWAMTGLLHDIDFEAYPDQHLDKAPDILREAGVGEDMIQSILSHGYGVCSDIKPEHQMEKVLYAIDELSGIIGAAALVRPSKSVSDMKLKSIKSKFKQKSFAAGCSRDTIQKGADMLGWTLDQLMTETLEAMQASEAVLKKEMEALSQE